MRPAFCAGAFRWATGFAAGVMLFFTIGVALPLFRILERAVAGAITTQLFPGYYIFIIAPLLIAIVSLFPILSKNKRNRIALVLVLVSLAGVLIIAHVLSPLLLQYNTPETIATFKKLHGVSMSLNLVCMLTTLAAPFFVREK
ncbi:MAG: DUF4149 domain-containing protein [Chthoniobacterales bacterium]